MISGAGMLDFLACQSAEKLVVDAEAIAMTRRLLDGMKVQTDTLATELFEGINFKGDFLKQKATRNLFKKEQHLPSAVIDRDSMRGWQEAGGLDTFARARKRTEQLLADYESPEIDPALLNELTCMVEDLAKAAGMNALPALH
jgi:trimethylamine--corrinoid protein Co-methyltransferase